ncbi:45189_t:CDS:2, partial [Gigaspora margarita]
MPRISCKLAVGGQISCKATVLPKDIIQQHFQQRGEDWQTLHLNDTIVRELTARKCQTYQVCFNEIENVIVDVLAGNLRYEKPTISNREEEEQAVTESLLAPEALSNDSESSLEEEEEQNIDVIDLSILVNWWKQPVTIDQLNVSSISLALPYELFHQFLPLNYIEQFVVDFINIRGRVSYHTLMIPNELDAPNVNDPLYSVCSFINAFNSEKNKIPGRCKILRKPHPIGQEWKTVADSFTNIIIQLEPCEEKEIEQKKQFTSEYGSTAAYNMIQKLGNTYGSYFSKVAVVNSTHLIVASLKDQKPQCIIAIASTTTQGDEVERVVKE